MPVGVGSVVMGSSPLTRGKPAELAEVGVWVGLIPAHAGKTYWTSHLALLARAHPRSRGENITHAVSERDGGAHPRSRGENGAWGGASCTAQGSSPLTRGKRTRRRGACTGRGLIPAHAGKTYWTSHLALLARAHPRSRGENRAGGRNPVVETGSSPLTRGKRGARDYGPDAGRLIPAHAGKTFLCVCVVC